MKAVVSSFFSFLAVALVAGTAMAGTLSDVTVPHGTTPVSPGSSCYYTNYNNNADVGEGSGQSLTVGQLVCP